MTFELLRRPMIFSLEMPLRLTSVLILFVYAVLAVMAVWERRRDFLTLTTREWAFLTAGLVLLIPAQRFLVIYREPGLLLSGAYDAFLFTSAISILGTAGILVIAYRFGPGPGLVAGFIAGLSWARFVPLIISDVLVLALWGFLMGYCLHQRYRGDLFQICREPMIGVVLSTFVVVLLLSLSRMAASQLDEGLHILDFAVALWRSEIPLWILTAVILGLGLQAAILLKPQWRLDHPLDRSSILSTSLRAQFMVISIPLVILSTLFSLLAVINRGVDLAREQSLQEMNRNARSAADNLRRFYITGSSLLQTFSEDPVLHTADPEELITTLDVVIKGVPFFQDLILSDDRRTILASMSTDGRRDGTPELSPEVERELNLAIEHGINQRAALVMSPSWVPGKMSGYVLIRRVLSRAHSERMLYLIGRAVFNLHPDIDSALESLQKTREQGTGFIIDRDQRIIAHPDPDLIGRTWEMDRSAMTYETRGSSDIAYETVTDRGEHVLVSVHTPSGLPDELSHQLVTYLPYTVVLQTATDITGPLLLVQMGFGLLLIVAILFSSARVTRPLNSLASAANRIARGNLEGVIDISGEDEVAQLGDAFEQMRVRLRDRLNDLSLLFETAQKVSATLDLERGVVPILEGALVESSGVIARFVVLGETDRPRRVFSVGQTLKDVESLDRGLARVLTRRVSPLVVQDLARSNQVNLQEIRALRSMAALPVKSQGRPVAVLWVGADRPHVFDEAKISFLSTLASQAAVLMENARLFRTAEGGRQRLAAILASTHDAILVSDAKSRLILTNPAARSLLNLDDRAVGRPLDGLSLPEPLVEALKLHATTARRVQRYQRMTPEGLRRSRSFGDDAASTVEVPMQDGRTFYASIAPITGDEGVTVGVVVVMRDVTHFKELDEMKSEFVATVSHDLRAPLTFMRGYTNMLTMVGELNARQRDYTRRILDGIEQMNALIGDLLDLRRVEAGVGIRREACRLGLILVEAVDTMRAKARSKQVTLKLEPAHGAPTVIGDRTLLRQVVSNLVDNAVKYTPSGGNVRVGLDVTDKRATIRVADTGIGIAPDDQVRLFEKFHRIKRRETADVKGTGLGLALVKSIIERHEGRVWVESALNEGSTFYVELPIPSSEELEDVKA
jgi:signal transduction histidine kinase/HAMP domain-containing protein